MLRELHISNLAVIEDVTIELGPGFNCFTGQTGAGKSLILGALEVLLGLKTGGAELVRPGVEEARVSGVFELRDPVAAAAAGAAADLTLAPGEALLVTRKFFASGRSSASINGQPATLSMIHALGEAMVDVHGQHDHQYLLRPANQLAVLDAFGQGEGLRQSYGQAYALLRGLRQRRDELHASRTLRAQQLDLYEFQAKEIDAAEPVEGELDRLARRHALLANLARIKREAGGAHAALYDSDGSVVERLQMIVHVLGELAEVDPTLRVTAEQVKSGTAILQDAAFDLGRYLDHLELDPGELAQVEERLNLLHRLAAKYSKPSAGVPASGDGAGASGGVLAYRHWLEGELGRLRGADSDASAIDRQVQEAQEQLAELGAKLSAARRAAAKRLGPLIERELRELGMSEAQFDVEFALAPDGGGAGGPEAVEMLVRTNPGQPARPLRKIASGGELSRIMLAIKSILAQGDRVSVLVFDEVDANVGGRLGTVLGRKLRGLARGGGQQVLCITHLPQIAAFADRHVRIAKQIEGRGKDKTTRTTVQRLDGEARIEELAEMLAGAGATATTRTQAREMVAAAAEGAAAGGAKKTRGSASRG
jgi:DNA repair protein RecN (Recombination protein N)